MSELRHECGLAAVYHLAGATPSGLCPRARAWRNFPAVAADAVGYSNARAAFGGHDFAIVRTVGNFSTTHKDVGSVGDVFRMSHRAKYERLMKQLGGAGGDWACALRHLRRR